MFFVFLLALSGLFLIFLEFFLPGAIMAVGGGLLLLASLFVFHMNESGTGSFLIYFFILMVSVYSVIKLALWKVESTKKNGTIYLESDQEGYQASLYPKELIGKIGQAATDLKPSGHILIGNQTFEALSKSGYIEKGTSLHVLDGHASYLIVKRLEEIEK